MRKPRRHPGDPRLRAEFPRHGARAAAFYVHQTPVVTASGEDLTATDDPGRIAMCQMAGVFAEFEKNRLVHKLRGARDRASAAAGRRVEGRKATLVGDALAMARRLRRRNPRTGARRSLRDIAAELAAAGHTNPATGKPYSAEAIRLALAGAKEAA